MNDQLAEAVRDSFDDLSAHHHALFTTYLELLLEGFQPDAAVQELARRSGETERYLCHVFLDELRTRMVKPSATGF
jgi:hypothetical protein